MWEDDPIVQQQNYRHLVGGTVLLSAVTLLVSLLNRDWDLLCKMLQVLAGVGLGLSIYAGATWIVVSAVKLAAKYYGKGHTANSAGARDSSSH